MYRSAAYGGHWLREWPSPHETSDETRDFDRHAEAHYVSYRRANAVPATEARDHGVAARCSSMPTRKKALPDSHLGASAPTVWLVSTKRFGLRWPFRSAPLDKRA